MKPFMMTKATGARPLTDEEISYVAGGDDMEETGPFDPPSQQDPPPYTTGATIDTSGKRKVDQGPGY